MRLSLLMIAVGTAIAQAATVSTAIIDITTFHGNTMRKYGVPGTPDGHIFIWDAQQGATATVWIESLDGQYSTPTAPLVTAMGNRNGVPTMFLSGWLRYDQALSSLIYGGGMQARLWVELEGNATPNGTVATTQRIGDITFSTGANLNWEPAPPPVEPVEETPEPGTWGMLGLGFAAMLVRRVLPKR